MLNHPTLDKLHELRFTGMAKALTEQMALPDIDDLSFEERLGLLIDREATEREDRRLQTRLRQAKTIPATGTTTKPKTPARSNSDALPE